MGKHFLWHRLVHGLLYHVKPIKCQYLWWSMQLPSLYIKGEYKKIYLIWKAINRRAQPTICFSILSVTTFFMWQECEVRRCTERCHCRDKWEPVCALKELVVHTTFIVTTLRYYKNRSTCFISPSPLYPNTRLHTMWFHGKNLGFVDKGTWVWIPALLLPGCVFG